MPGLMDVVAPPSETFEDMLEDFDCAGERIYPDCDKMHVCQWPDGTWCGLDEIDNYSWMSDDYEVIAVDASTPDIDTFLFQRAHGLSIKRFKQRKS
jgi:hypothetical protein